LHDSGGIHLRDGWQEHCRWCADIGGWGMHLFCGEQFEISGECAWISREVLMRGELSGVDEDGHDCEIVFCEGSSH